MRFKTAFLSFLTVISLNIANAQSIRFYQITDFDDYGQVLDMSIKEDKLMLLVVFRNNGIFEEMIRSGVFRDDSLKGHFENIIPVAIYRQTEMAERLMQSFGEKSMPTFLLMNSEEFLLNAAYGKQSEAGLIDFIVSSGTLGEQLDGLRTNYKRHKLTDQEWVVLIGLYELNLDFLSTQSLAYEFLSDVPEASLLNDTIKPVSLAYGISLETPYAEKILKQRSQLDSAEFADFFEACYSFNLDLASENKDTLLLQKIIKVLIPESSIEDSIRPELVMETQILFARETGLFKIWQDAVLEYCETLSDTAEKAEFAFKEAFEIAEVYNSGGAQDAAKMLASKASSWNPDYRYYMLESYMAYLIKDYDEALEIVEKALKLSENETDTNKAVRLKTIIRSEKGIE